MARSGAASSTPARRRWPARGRSGRSPARGGRRRRRRRSRPARRARRRPPAARPPAVARAAAAAAESAGHGRRRRPAPPGRGRRVRVVEVVDVHGCSSAQVGPRRVRRRSSPARGRALHGPGGAGHRLRRLVLGQVDDVAQDDGFPLPGRQRPQRLHEVVAAHGDSDRRRRAARGADAAAAPAPAPDRGPGSWPPGRPRPGRGPRPAPARQCPGHRLLGAVLGLGPPSEHGVAGPVPHGEQLVEPLDESCPPPRSPATIHDRERRTGPKGCLDAGQASRTGRGGCACPCSRPW